MILYQHLFKARTQSEIDETVLAAEAAAAFVFHPTLLTLTGTMEACHSGRCTHFAQRQVIK